MAKGPAILFTGASGVIGRAILGRLARDPEWKQTRFVAAQRSADAPFADERIKVLPLDLADESQLRAFVAGPLQEEGPWAGAALVAGICQDQALPRLPEADWDRVLAVNAGSCRALLAALVRKPGLILPGASFLMVSSIAAARGSGGQAAYAASKGLVLDLMSLFQRPFAAQGARLNTLLPPLVESPMMSSMSAAAKAGLFAQRLLNDPQPEKTCGESAAFFLSRRSSYVHAMAWHADSRISGLPWPV